MKAVWIAIAMGLASAAGAQDTTTGAVVEQKAGEAATEAKDAANSAAEAAQDAAQDAAGAVKGVAKRAVDAAAQAADEAEDAANKAAEEAAKAATDVAKDAEDAAGNATDAAGDAAAKAANDAADAAAKAADSAAAAMNAATQKDGAADVEAPAISAAQPGILNSWIINRRIWTTNKPESTPWTDGPLTERPADWQDIAKVDDIVLSDEGEVIGYIADIGGFLGIGAKKVLLGRDAIHLMNVNGDWFFATNLTKPDLESLPGFDPASVLK